MSLDPRDALKTVSTAGNENTLSEAGEGSEREQAKTANNATDSSLTGELMERVVAHDNLQLALHKVCSNKGAPGVDGMTYDELKPWLQANEDKLRKQLLSKHFHPQPVRRVEIPKAGGGSRFLGIPTVIDRLVQQAVLQVLQPLLDPQFSDSSFGFRPSRSAQQAIERAQGYLDDGYVWVVDIDLDAFFERVHHDVLMARVARRISDKRVLKLLRAFVESGVLVQGVVMNREDGTPQGGPLSPLLANVLLDDVDKELEARGHRFVRYADDCNVYLHSERAAQRVFQSLRKSYERLRLRINEDKSAVGLAWGRTFLGFTFERKEEGITLEISERSRKRLREKIV